MNRGRKTTGGRYHKQKKKKLHSKTNQERKTVLGERRIKILRGRGGNIKTVSLRANTASVIVDKKVQKTEIKNVVETPQNSFLSRQNRLMKGAIIETTLGKAKITNRPSQEGQVNAVLIKEKN